MTTHYEKEQMRLGKVALSNFLRVVENLPDNIRGEFFWECLNETAQKTILKNYLGDKAALAKELCDVIADFIRQHQ